MLAAHSRRWLAATIASGAASALLVCLAPAPAYAAVTETTVELPFVNVADVVASETQVFVSGGHTTGSIVVTTPSGGNPTTFGDLPGPTDLELSPDGATLFATLPNANEIAIIDTATLQETARVWTGVGECPSSLVASGATLWFGYGCDQWGGNIGRINLAVSPPAVTVGLSPVDFYDYPLLNMGRSDPGRLFAGQPSLSPGEVSVFTVGADGSLAVAGQTGFSALGSNLRDVAVAPAGDQFYTAAGYPYEILQFQTDQLTTARRRFVTGPYPNAVEISHDGAQVAAAADSGGLFVFRPTSSQPTQLPLTGTAGVVDRGIAWAPSGARLYAVTDASWMSDPPPAVLHVYTASIAARIVS
jgi:YVTN family beta-propeller protein